MSFDNYHRIQELRKLNVPSIASWALYDISDKDIEAYMKAKTPYLKSKIINKDSIAFPTRYLDDKSLAQAMNASVMLLGLNAAERDIASQDWTSFHDTSAHSKDRHIVFDLYHTKFHGAYMTDLFKRLPVTDSKKIDIEFLIDIMKLDDAQAQHHMSISNKKQGNLIQTARQSLRDFQSELDILQPKIILQYHTKVAQGLKLMIDNDLIRLPKDCTLISQTHYSHPLYTNEQRLTDLVEISNTLLGE